MRTQTRLIAGAVALLAVALAACGDDDTNGGDPTPGATGTAVTAPEVLLSSAPRTNPDQAAMSGASQALDQFGFDIYEILAREDGNIVFSPYSAAVALAMTRAGAAGETLEQMNAVLHADLAGDLDAGLNAIDQVLATRPGEYQWADKTVELDLATANQLWGQTGFPFHDAFLDQLAANYGAGLRLVDYIEAREDARAAINAWVAEQTRDRIPQLIPEGALTEDTRLVLTNAIYLNAPWMHRFSEDGTEPMPFTLPGGGTVDAEMMRLSARLSYVAGDGYEAVELPYADGSLAMVVIVPEAGEFEAFQSAFDSAALDEVLAGLDRIQVNLRFPKFEFRTQAGLKNALIELGMPIAFDEGAADFSGMSPQGNIFIQDVLQEAFIAVDEHGTEAAAATAVIAGATSAPPEIVDLDVDRPFLFLIRDTETGATLFMGRVLDPTAE